MHAFLVAIALALAVPTSAMVIFDANVMGRFAFGDNGDVRFDHPGVVFGMQWQGGLTNVSAIMSVVHANASSTPRAAGAAAATDAPAVGYQPHQFAAYVFAGATTNGDFVARPPRLSDAFATMNFTTVGWVSGAMVEVPLFQGLDVDMATSLFVVKLTEADWNQAYFDANYVTLHGYSAHAAAAMDDATPVHITVPAITHRVAKIDGVRRRRIEFVGDSITAGYCNLCDADNTFASEAFSLTWGYRTAQAFDAEYHAEAWSGYGVVRNCNGGNVLMPEVFQRAVATVGDMPWNFSTWVPDALIINLGTNDHLDPVHPGPFERLWVDRFTEFVNRTVNEDYIGNPEMAVYLACGPMQTAPMCVFVNETLTRLAPPHSKASHRFHFLNFADIFHSNEDTCCGHPSGHHGDVIMANITIARLEETLGWKSA